ncbi:ABC transporter ATP-binding protein [Micrococcus sp. FDAARGOS_333]|uniref:ABC transporter ATP-binding protein n=1 Tax=Micrococcus sp. FDAARGOS_333 TaxID=1930558 RepID=UPI000B4DEEFF|nr:ABC transporter ATP-binding protein [Micrococcus sp. FDAARGOS_333]PNL18822.1 iron ABC transporter ATP-binding protein [Micrococcus sp. FDAARGOS_333]
MTSLLRILRFAPQLRPLYLGIAVSAVLMAVLSLATPFLIGAATDRIVDAVSGSATVEETLPAVAWLAAAFFAVEVLATAVISVGGYWGDVMAARMRTILSARYFEHLLHLPQKYFDTAITGRVTNRLNRSITELTQFLNFFANNAFTMLITTAAVLAISAFYWWPLAVLLAVVFPVYMWLTAKTSKKWQVWEGEKNREIDIASGRFTEVVAQMPVVRSYNRQGTELAGFTERFRATIGITRRQSNWWHSMDAARRLALNVVFGVLYLLVFLRTAQGHFSVGDMVILIQLMTMARQPIMNMSYLVDSAQRAVAGSKDYFDVLAEEREDGRDGTAVRADGEGHDDGTVASSGEASVVVGPAGEKAEAAREAGRIEVAERPADVAAAQRATADEDPGAGPLRELAARAGSDVPAVRFSGVHFAYDSGAERDVLDGVDFEVRQGEKVALVGESGGGKSTITNLLMGLYPVRSGRIEVFGQDVERMGLPALRGGIAAVFQEPNLFSGTVRENIAYADPAASDERVRAAAKAAFADGFVEDFPERYEQLIGERGLRLSGGQRQRIAVARAVLKDAPILILDEATSSLDTKSERLVQAALDELMVGRSSLIVAHRLSTIASVDRIVTLKGGHVDEVGTPAELAESGGIYSQLLQLQQAGTKQAKKLLKEFGIAG